MPTDRSDSIYEEKDGRACKAKLSLFAQLGSDSSSVSRPPLSAQEFRGTINGTVTDSGGAGHSRSENPRQATWTPGSARTQTSNQDGLYQVPFLFPGNYSVTAEADRIQKGERSGIRVDANANVTVNLSLVVGSVY